MRELRILRGINQDDLARAGRMCRSYISKYERGYCIPSIPQLTRLAAALDVDLVDLVDERIPVRELAGLYRRDATVSEIASLAPGLDPLQRSNLLGIARNLVRGQGCFTEWENIS